MKSTQWKIAVGTAVLGLCSLAAYGQAGEPQGPPPGPPSGNMERMQGPDRELKMLTRVLTLTPDQQTGVKAVLEQQATQMKALRAKNEAADGSAPESRQARMTQMDQIRDESNTKISALLDDTQKKTFADWVQRRKAAMERRHQDGNPPPPPDGAGNGPGGSDR
jgi:protein CpxP